MSALAAAFADLTEAIRSVSAEHGVHVSGYSFVLSDGSNSLRVEQGSEQSVAGR